MAVERKIKHSDPPPIPWQKQELDRVSLWGAWVLRKYRGLDEAAVRQYIREQAAHEQQLDQHALPMK